jgi:hypothetical protein
MQAALRRVRPDDFSGRLYEGRFDLTGLRRAIGMIAL